MKKIIAILFTLQLIVLGTVSLLTMRMNSFDTLFFDNRTEIELHFFDNLEHFEYFLTVVQEQNVPLSRAIFTSFDSMRLYTTDPTFDGFITLQEGYFPIFGTDEFVSNVYQSSEQQVGLMNNQFPQFDIEIRYLSGIQNFNLNGTYHIHTTEYVQIREIQERLDAAGISILQIRLNDAENQPLAESLFSGVMLMSSTTEIIFSLLIPVITFIIIIATLMSHNLNSIKYLAIPMIHGYSKGRSISISVRSVLRPLLLAGFFAYGSLVIYILLSNATFFLPLFSLTFLAWYTVLMFIYLTLIIVFQWIILSVVNNYQAIKGFKPDAMAQSVYHGLKILFTLILLIAGHFAIVQGRELIERQAHLEGWEIAQHIYRIPQSHIWSDGQLDYEYTMRLIDFYTRLANDHDAFIMNSSFIETYELHGFPMMSFGEINPANTAIHPFINRIDLTLNYLTLNPIATANEIAIKEQIIIAPNVLNLLVPDALSPYEAEIKTLYRTYFYHQSIRVGNDLRYSFNMEELDYREEDIVINIIYVLDDQAYFSFNTRVRAEVGNQIIDPITVVQTGNANFTEMAALLSTSLYFVSDAEEPLDEISATIQDHGLSYIVRFVYSVFGENTDMLATLEADMIRHTIMILSLGIGSLMVSYGLVSNYFEKNKFKLFIKELSGFSLAKKHYRFIFPYLIYIILVTGLIALLLGTNSVIIGLILLAMDSIFFLISERHLTKKSFAELLKGER